MAVFRSSLAPCIASNGWHSLPVGQSEGEAPEMPGSFLDRQRDCLHASTISVFSAGVERFVCEDCGHAGFRYESQISRDIDRTRFSRDADESPPRGRHTRIE